MWISKKKLKQIKDIRADIEYIIEYLHIINHKIDSLKVGSKEELPTRQPNIKEMQLDYKDIVCATRIIQSSLFENPTGIFFGCQYCKYSEDCMAMFKKNGEMYIGELRIKLQEITGVNLNYFYNPDNLEAKFKDITK